MTMWKDATAEGRAAQFLLPDVMEENEARLAREAMERRLAEKNKPKRKSIYRNFFL